ncbi:hypothetical protein OIU92_28795 [Escherichia coli]|nr:hypothetical protein [Escherichia coli]
MVTIAAAAVNPDSATRNIYYLQQQGKTVLQIAGLPVGMLIWRTVAMITHRSPLMRFQKARGL